MGWLAQYLPGCYCIEGQRAFIEMSTVYSDLGNGDRCFAMLASLLAAVLVWSSARHIYRVRIIHVYEVRELKEQVAGRYI